MQAGGQRFDPAQLHQGGSGNVGLPVIHLEKQVCKRTSVRLPVLHDIVKRRFVRVPRSELDPERPHKPFVSDRVLMDVATSRKTLNLAHMIGLPNRAIEQISRSWSF